MKRLSLSLACALFLAACSSQPGHDPDLANFRSGHTQRTQITVPNVLVSPRANGSYVDLNNAKEVADAMGTRLNGRTDQYLYTIYLAAPSSEHRVERREIPIRVDNISMGATMIRAYSDVPSPKKTVAKKKSTKKKK